MTPKEKAEELVKKYTDMSIFKFAAKQCALIAVHLKEHIKNDKIVILYVAVHPGPNYYDGREIIKIFKYKKDAEKFIRFHPYDLEIDEHELIIK